MKKGKEVHFRHGDNLASSDNATPEMDSLSVFHRSMHATGLVKDSRRCMQKI